MNNCDGWANMPHSTKRELAEVTFPAWFGENITKKLCLCPRCIKQVKEDKTVQEGRDYLVIYPRL